MISDLDSNKRVVTDFYRTAFGGNTRQAVANHVGDPYIQHHPSVPDGTDAFISLVEQTLTENPDFDLRIKRVIAEGDLVVCHSQQTIGPRLPAQALIDISRLESSKIVEHWDVIQDIPSISANKNGMV